MRKVAIMLIICLAYQFVPAQNWQQAGLGAYNSGVYELYADSINNLLYGGGNFKTSTGDTIWSIAKWDGTKWDSLGSGMKNVGVVGAITIYNGQLIAGGLFNEAGGVSVNNIARWNGTAWDSLGGVLIIEF